jgi:hypothetical protein
MIAASGVTGDLSKIGDPRFEYSTSYISELSEARVDFRFAGVPGKPFVNRG